MLENRCSECGAQFQAEAEQSVCAQCRRNAAAFSTEQTLRTDLHAATSQTVRKSFKQRWPKAAIQVVAPALLVSAVAFVAMLCQPDFYFAKSTLELRSDSLNTSTADPIFLEAHVKWMRKPSILEAVVRELDLTKAFSKDEHRTSMRAATVRLENSLKIRPISNTNRVEIGAYQRDPQLAADVANAIAAQYRKALKSNIDRTRRQLRDDVEKAREKMEAAKQEVKRIMESAQIVDSAPEEMIWSEPCRG